jgi:hypothetical protein
MKYTRRFILDMIKIASMTDAGNRHVSIELPTVDKKHYFVLTYDVQDKKVNSVIEYIGRRKRVASVDDLLNETNPTIQ